MRIAHISDLHFGSFSLSPFQFFSKRWLGNFNFLLKRKKEFAPERLNELVDLFKAQNVTHVIITGDLSVTSRRVEFTKAKKFIELLKSEGFEVFIIPGNHDHYTKLSDRRKTFYSFFDSQYDPQCPLNLKDHRVTYTRLGDRRWLVGLDTALATSWVSSGGCFNAETEENLKRALSAIPSNDSILLLNHFPFFQNDAEKKQMLRAPLLKNLISEHPNILVYLHGHTHRQTVADLRPNRLPIISDSGSTPHIKEGACHLFEWSNKDLKLSVYRHDNGWKETETHNFSL